MRQPSLFEHESCPPEPKEVCSLSTTNGHADGVFGWYRYVQDFTGEFALGWLKKLATGAESIWEPFSGSGTTLVAAKLLDIPSVGFDMSPFMVDVARTKLDWTLDIAKIDEFCNEIISRCERDLPLEPSDVTRIPWDEYDRLLSDSSVIYPSGDSKLRKWISPAVLTRATTLLAAIADVRPAAYRDFLRLGAAGLLVPASNMTFRPNICYESKAVHDFPLLRAFRTRIRQMMLDYIQVAGLDKAPARVSVGDARSAGPERADVIFTSPPYPNDMEYVHQTRLELMLLHHVSSTKDLTSLKKQMISSSVKLVYRDNAWQKTAGLELSGVRVVHEQLAETLAGKNWGWNAADMVAQYFGGMRTVFANWSHRLAPGGLAAVVIGDSAFNGVKVCSDTLLAESADAEGFEVCGIEPFRTRWNSKHTIELRESVVVLRNRQSGPAKPTM